VSSGVLNNAASGTLSGSGTVNVTGSSLSNAGNLNPGSSPGILTLTGAMTQTSTGALNVELNKHFLVPTYQ